jgi:uncharacterized protein YegP (UPF0339 family)
MPGKFEIYKDKAGKFRFRLKAGNGEIIAVGEAYESKASALHGIESIRSNAEAASLVDLTDSEAKPGMSPKPQSMSAGKPGMSTAQPSMSAGQGGMSAKPQSMSPKP